MAHYADDIHRRFTTRLSDVIPDFVEADYPKFVTFLKAYYEFLEQYDRLPIASTYVTQNGTVSVQASNSTIVGSGTQFSNTAIFANNVNIRVGADTFRIRSIANNTQLTIYNIPVRAYYGNTFSVETNRSTRQASGALRQVLTFHDVAQTIDDFIPLFRDTYLRDIPQGLTETKCLIPQILDFYQSRGSESSFRYLFRAFFDKEIEFFHPQDSVFTTSDNEYIVPRVVRLDYDDITGDPASLETRNIIGLRSNTRATVLKTAVAYEGSTKVMRLFIDTPTAEVPRIKLLTEAGASLQFTAFGIPPDGFANQIYSFTAIQEAVIRGKFESGETISTLPLDDPSAITGDLLGSIVGFQINDGGSGYAIGDLISPPGGFGGLGRVSAFTNIDIEGIIITEPGLGYYEGLPLIIDNTGTGGSGLAGYVSAVAPGNLVLHEDGAANITDGDTLLFTSNASPTSSYITEFEASRESITYYEVGVSLNDVLDTDGGGPDPTVNINASSWSANTGSALYNVNLTTPVIYVLSRLSSFPIYREDTNALSVTYGDAIEVEVGEVSAIEITDIGSGYLLGIPTASVETPDTLYTDNTLTDVLSNTVIFGEPGILAELEVEKTDGQIGQIEVLKGGSGYSTTPFFVNAITSTTKNGDGTANVAVVLGAESYGSPRFKNTKSFTSDAQYLQDITKYQPFSYELTVEENLKKYWDALYKLVHPSGGLLLPRQSITTEIDTSITISDIEVESTPHRYRPTDGNSITASAPSTGIGVTFNYGVNNNIISVGGPSDTEIENEEAVYGYVVGGWPAGGPDYVATADRITFSTSTTAAHTPANLSQARGYLAGLSDGSVYGYAVGGYSSSATVATADRITFSTSTTAAHTPANLSQARYGLPGLSDGSVYGYVVGGYTTARVDTTDRITFSTSTTAAHTPANLSQALLDVAALSDGAVYGYAVGGYTSGPGYVATADRITFSTSTTAAHTPANLSVARAEVAGLSDGAIYGYAVGGYTGARVVTADRITFSTSTTAAHTPANLSVARSEHTALSDGSVYGYLVGGSTAGASVATADRITFSTSTTAAHTPANLSQARDNLAGLSDGAV